ncbi:MAG: phosphomannomutase/phosphoglucomutase, partial [Gammaproteobacteria bacterium]
FPQHPPDPTRPANLEDLRKVVAGTGADLGIALDGDGDRLVAVSGSGRIVWPDELLMIFARDILTSHSGADVVFDVKSTRRLTSLVNGYGGRAVMHRTGHSHIRSKVAELKAPLGGEFSGHIFFGDRWFGFDDALYAAARLIEILCLREQSLDSVLAAFETSVATAEIRLPVSEVDKFALIERIRAAATFDDAEINAIDGLRVEFAAGWGLIRASNTESAVSMRFEADDAQQLAAIQQRFRTLLEAVAPELADKF